VEKADQAMVRIGLPKARSNTALVRTEQRLSVCVQGYLPPHNFTVISIWGKYG